MVYGLCLLFLVAVSPTPATSLDPTFNFGSGFDGDVLEISRDSKGRLLVGGRFNSYNGVQRRKIARLLPDGQLDETFMPGSGPRSGFVQNGVDTGQVSSIVALEDGSMMVKGWFSSFSGHNVNDLAPLNEDGSVNTTFALDYGNVFQNSISSVAVDSAGRLLVGGRFRLLQGVAVTNLARISLDGSVDTSYAAEVTNAVAVRHIYPDEKVLLELYGSTPGGIPTTELVRLNTDGTRDNTFIHEFEYRALGALHVLPDGAVLAAFLNNNFSSSLKKLRADGSADPEFSPPAFGGRIFAIDHQSNGKIILGGIGYEVGPLERGVLRLQANGAIDPYYPSGVGARTVLATLVLPDDRVIFGGGFTNVDFGSHNRIAAFLANSPAPKAEIIYQNGGDSLAVYWNAARNGIYELQENDSLQGGVWRSLTREIGSGYNQQLIVPIHSQSNRIFRLRIEVQ